MLPVIVVFCLAASARWWSDVPFPERVMPTGGTPRSLQATEWWTGAYAELPVQRVDLRGQPGQEFDLQWAGYLPEIEEALKRQGWQEPTTIHSGSLLHWLSTSSSIDLLPVLPLVHAGSHPKLALRRPLDDEQQLMIRLWPSGWKLDSGEPIWLGTVVTQQARTYYRLLRYPVTETEVTVEFVPPAPYEQRRVPAATGQPLMLISLQPNLYTEPYLDAPPDARPHPLPPSSNEPEPL